MGVQWACRGRSVAFPGRTLRKTREERGDRRSRANRPRVVVVPSAWRGGVVSRAPHDRVRILFAFDPSRNAVLHVAGDKAGAWKRWYTENIPLAEVRYEKWLAGDFVEEEGGSG